MSSPKKILMKNSSNTGETSEFDPKSYSTIDLSEATVAKLIQRNRSLHHKTPDFERMASEGNYFIHLVAEEMNIDRYHAGRIVVAVLHSFRDSLSLHDAIRFSQGLPTALRAVFFDHYQITAVPAQFKTPLEFLKYVRDSSAGSIDDFPDPRYALYTCRAVFNNLYDLMDPDHLDHFIKKSGAVLESVIQRHGPVL